MKLDIAIYIIVIKRIYKTLPIFVVQIDITGNNNFIILSIGWQCIVLLNCLSRKQPYTSSIIPMYVKLPGTCQN